MTKLIIVGVIVFTGLLAGLAVREAYEWEEFRAEHHCKVVAHIDGSSSLGTGISSSGNVVTTTVYTSPKTGWLCDDGVTYYR